MDVYNLFITTNYLIQRTIATAAHTWHPNFKTASESTTATKTAFVAGVFMRIGLVMEVLLLGFGSDLMVFHWVYYDGERIII